MHAPVFQGMKNRAGEAKFMKDAKADIQAVMDLLYKRGMWSKFHYEKWTQGLKELDNEVLVHGWWDDIVASAMYELDADKVQAGREQGLAAMLREEEH